MLLLRIASDIHLEWRRNTETHLDIIPADELDKESILVLAGDIGAGRPLFNFMKTMCDRFPYVLWVPGNHEYYGSQGYNEWNEVAAEKYQGIDNLLFTPGTVGYHLVGGMQLIAGTMWTDCNGRDPIAMSAVERTLSDFRGAIPRWTVEWAANVHDSHKFQIESFLKHGPINDPKIVVTHHTPSPQLTSSRFIGDACNPGFHANCEDLMHSNWSPKLWVFGHTHDQIHRQIGNTLCVNNPLGYPNEISGVNYMSNFFVDVSKPQVEFL